MKKHVELKEKRGIIAIAFFLLLPTILLLGTDSVFSSWLFGSGFTGDIMGPPPIDISANPTDPISPGTLVIIEVKNSSGYNIEDAKIVVTQSNGTRILEVVTDTEGVAIFEYPGTPVSILVSHEDYRSEVIVVGVAPSIWYFALGTLLCGSVIIGGLAIQIWLGKRELQVAYDDLEDDYNSLLQLIKETKSLGQLRSATESDIKDCIKSSDIKSDTISRELIVFIESREIHEHLFYGLEFARTNVTNDKRLDKKFAVFALTQTFEELILQLGLVSDDDEVKQVFANAQRPAISWMLKQLFKGNHEMMHAAIKEFGGFTRGLGTYDFNSKLESLLSNELSSENWRYKSKLDQPALDFAIATLVRNYTHHQPMLDAVLFTDDSVFRITINHILSAMVRVYHLVHP